MVMTSGIFATFVLGGGLLAGSTDYCLAFPFAVGSTVLISSSLGLVLGSSPGMLSDRDRVLGPPFEVF